MYSRLCRHRCFHRPLETREQMELATFGPFPVLSPFGRQVGNNTRLLDIVKVGKQVLAVESLRFVYESYFL